MWIFLYLLRLCRRSSRCSIEELVDLTFAWLAERKRFKVEDEAYHEPTPLSLAG
jgi:hypothetical protein